VRRRWRASAGRKRSDGRTRPAGTEKADRRVDSYRHRGCGPRSGRIDYAIAGLAFETPSKPGYGPEIGGKGLAEIAAAADLPILAIGGLNATRAAEVLAVGPVGIAVMGAVMRAASPGQEVRGLISVLAQARSTRGS
jgi:hypothetical protein